MDWKKGQQCLMIRTNGLTRGERVFLFTPSSSNCHRHDFCCERINRDNSRFKKILFPFDFFNFDKCCFIVWTGSVCKPWIVVDVECQTAVVITGDVS